MVLRRYLSVYWDKRLWLKGREHYEDCDRERRPLIKTS